MSLHQDRLYYATINISTSGDNTIITPNVGEMPATWDTPATRIVIDHINLQANGTTTLQFKNGTSGEGQTSYGGAYNLVAQAAIVLENVMVHEQGIITLAPNRSFVINLGSSVQVSGFVRYRLQSVK